MGRGRLWVLARRADRIGTEYRSCVSIIEGDLFSEALEKDLPPALDTVFHLAGIGSPRKAAENPLLASQVNIAGTQRMLEVAKNHRARFIYAGSGEVYSGITELPWREDMPVRPETILGVTKAAAELFVHAYCALWGMSSVILRIFTAYGPGAGEDQLVSAVLRKIRHAAEKAEFGPGDSVRDCVFIDDVVEAFLAADAYCAARPCHDVFNIGSGVGTRVKELVQKVIGLMGKQRITVVFDDSQSGGLVTKHIASPDKARSLLGWRAQVSLDEGLRRSL